MKILFLLLSIIQSASAATLYNFQANQMQMSGTDIFDPRMIYPITGGLYNVTYTNIILTNLPAGSTDIMTVPSGKVLNVVGCFTWTTNSTTVAAGFFINDSGTYYRVRRNFNTTISTPGQASILDGIVTSGYVLSMTNNNAGLYLNFWGRLIDDTYAITTHQLLGVTTSTNLVYTVPEGKMAVAFAPPAFGVAIQGPTMFISNDSGAGRTCKIFIVPSGGTPSSDNMIASGLSVANNNAAFPSLPVLTSGTSVYVASDSSASPQAAFITGWEVATP